MHHYLNGWKYKLLAVVFYFKNIAPKLLNLLEVLKKGLAKFTETIKTRKKELSAKLAWAETISSSDKNW
jgi:hypothetical protein